MSNCKIIEYLKDHDFLNFIKYTLFHPKLQKWGNVVQTFPPYLAIYGGKLNINPNKLVKDIRLLNSWNLYRNNEYSGEDKWNVRLARTKINDIDDNCWNLEFPDNEDYAALHRFIWMYNEVVFKLEKGVQKKIIKKKVIYFIESWIKRYLISPVTELHPEIYQTYSVAERVVNWLYALSAVSDEAVLKEEVIFDAIVQQVIYICRHLEYYGEDFTGNHLLNDGKAIYIAGMMLNVELFQNIGRTIIEKEIERIFVNDGFLREGSVHYQFLITKNYTDIYWVASYFHDNETLVKIKPHLIEMVYACQYFQIENKKGEYEIPLIGDISPDYTPQWIMYVPQVALYLLTGEEIQKNKKPIGYHSVFVHMEQKKDYQRIQQKEETRVLQDWAKIRKDDWIIFAHVNHSMYPNNLTGHFHHDTGAFVLYYKSNCILCDCGRYTYELTERGMRDKKIQAHCGIMIDGMQPEMDMRTFYSKTFCEYYLKSKPEIKLSEFQLEVIQNGFRRIKKVDSVKRIINIGTSYIEINDVLEGKGMHNVKFFFHTYGYMEKNENGFTIKNQDDLIKVKVDSSFHNIKIISGKDQKVEGKAALSYGESIDIMSVICETRVKFPCTIHTKIVRG